MTSAVTYPVRVEASLDSPLSRWLWLVKWLLAIPHYVVLAFLWLAFVVLSAVAFFAILFTGRYPRAIFEFNVGVLRWTWRVQYYTYGALGTDRYPPFTLADVPDYPARLDIAYPERLSRGLVLVKWWLLAIPHYLIAGLFVGGGAWVAWQFDNTNFSWGAGGLIGLLVLVAAIVLAFTGRYPQPIYDFVLGMNRWVLRVAAYAGLMTDDYPPFRLDMGGHDPGGTLTLSWSGPPAPMPSQGTGATGPPPPPPPAGRPAGEGWTAGRIATVVVGSVLALASLPMLGVGGVSLAADQALRDDAGYVSFGTDTFRTSGYAVASDRIALRGVDAGWGSLSSLIGTVRIRATSIDPEKAVFVGIAPARAAASYLAGVDHTVVRDLTDATSAYRTVPGTAPSTPPTDAGIWTAQVSGPGTQTLIWPVTDGDWTLVAMNEDGSPGANVRVQTAATVPALLRFAVGLLIGGIVVLAAGVVLIAIPVRRAAR